MSSNVKLRLVGVFLFATVVFAIFGTLVRSKYGSPGRRDISGGLEIQRSRIDRVTAIAEAASIDEAVNSLATYGDPFELAQLASLSPASRHVHFISQILSDRRGCKIFEELLALPREDASRKANEIFLSQFDKFIYEWSRFANSKGHENTGVVHHAASYGLFLCSYFCDQLTLAKNLSLWDKAMDDAIYNKIDGVQLLKSSRFIDPLFRLNLLVISGARSGASIAELNRELEPIAKKISGDSVSFLVVKQLKMFRWNATTIDKDLTSVIRGVPASANSVLIELPGFSDPDAVGFLKDKQALDALVQTITIWRSKRAE